MGFPVVSGGVTGVESVETDGGIEGGVESVETDGGRVEGVVVSGMSGEGEGVVTDEEDSVVLVVVEGGAVVEGVVLIVVKGGAVVAGGVTVVGGSVVVSGSGTTVVVGVSFSGNKLSIVHSCGS